MQARCAAVVQGVAKHRPLRRRRLEASVRLAAELFPVRMDSLPGATSTLSPIQIRSASIQMIQLVKTTSLRLVNSMYHWIAP